MAEEPAEKKQRLEEPAQDETGDAEMKEDQAQSEAAAEGSSAPKLSAPEPPKELEEDAAPVAQKDVNKEGVAFLVPDTTINLLTASNGNVLMSMNEGGIQHFLAGARANIGVKKGRYFFEAKVLEYVNVTDAQGGPSFRTKNVVRVGFSTASSSLVIGSTEDSFCFDSEGYAISSKQRGVSFPKFGRDAVVGVLLNLDESSANANTISLFKDGRRLTQPQPLPEQLKGKTLYPHVSFKNASLHVNFGPEPLAALPFKCTMVQEAAKAHVEMKKAASMPANGKFEVVCPVGLPDEGTFDWLDMWKAKHPTHTELSDRMILEWAEQSAIPKPGGYGRKSCNDKPEMSFGVVELDNQSMKKAVYSIAPLQRRNYVVMEVKSNLLKEDREQLLSKFDEFKKVATVVMGEPSPDFKTKVQEITLSQKQEAANLKHQHDVALKAAEKKRKEMAKEAAAKAKAEEAAAKEANAGEEAKEGEEQEEKKEEKEEKEEEKEEDEEELPEEAPKVALDAEEKKRLFVEHPVKDLTPMALSASFTKFTLPESAEGFDEIRHEWQKDVKCKDYLKKWVLDKKLTLRAEELQPGAWAMQKIQEWNSTIGAWHQKVNEYKVTIARKEQQKKEKEAKAAAKAAKAAAGEGEGEGEEAKPEEEKAEEEKDPAEETAKEGQDEEKEGAEGTAMDVEADEEEEPLDFSAVDVFGAEDILNVGQNTPLFKDFGFEDWAMMCLRFELWLAAVGFRKDVDDAERPGIFLEHLPFYFQRYHKKTLNIKEFGVETVEELVALVSDTMYVTPKKVLESQIAEDVETFAIFVKLTEEARRYRLLRLDLGDESAKLNVTAGRAHGKGFQKGGWGQQGAWNNKGTKGWQQGPPKGAPKGHVGGGVPPPPAGGYGKGPAPPFHAKGTFQKGVQPPYGKGAPPPGAGYGGYPSYGKAQDKKGCVKGFQPYAALPGKGCGKDMGKGWGGGGKGWGGCKGGKW